MGRQPRGRPAGAARGRAGGRRPQAGRASGRRGHDRPGRPPRRDKPAAAKGQPQPRPPSAADLLDGARGLFRQKRYGEALGAFDSVLAAAKGGRAGGASDKVVRRESDRCGIEVDKSRDQLGQIRRRMQAGGADAAAAAALACKAAACEFRLGLYGRALETLEAAGGGAAGHAADMLAGECLSALRRHAEAEDAYLHALDDGGITAAKCVQIGDMLAGSGRHAGAESAYARAFAKGADVHRKLDNCRARIGRTDFAPGGAERGDRAGMAVAAGRMMDRAMRLDREGRYDDAVPAYIEAFRADPGMPDGFADRMGALAAAAAGGRGAGGAGGEAPHNASRIPGGTVFVVDSNVCIMAMIILAMGRARPRPVPRSWAALAGVASSFEKNVRSGAYALTFKVYHETRSLLYSTRGMGDLLLGPSREAEVCRAAVGRLDKLWAAHGIRARPSTRLVDEARRAMWAGWMAASSSTKDSWRSRKEAPERPYRGGCSGEWADAFILATAIMIMRGAGPPADGAAGGGGAGRPRAVALLTRDSDFTMFAGGITEESRVRIVGEFA